MVPGGVSVKPENVTEQEYEFLKSILLEMDFAWVPKAWLGERVLAGHYDEVVVVLSEQATYVQTEAAKEEAANQFAERFILRLHTVREKRAEGFLWIQQ